MIERHITVTNARGIHARPASLIAQTSAKFKSDITLTKDGTSADAKSIMNVMILAATQHSDVLIRATGEDEKDAVEAIAELFTKNFNEE